MKTMLKIIAFAMITVFAAVSCAPPEVEVSDYDWSDVNAQQNPELNGGNIAASTYAPSASLVKYTWTKDKDGADTKTIDTIDVNITFHQRADVLRETITAASLNFITFHTFTKADKDLTEDTLSAPIPFTLEKRQGNTVSVKLTANIDTTKDFSNLLMRVDGKNYTYSHGLRLDIDANGKIEDKYDDWYTPAALLILPNASANDKGEFPVKATSYTGPGNKDWSIYFSSLPTTYEYEDADEVKDATDNKTLARFYFTGKGTTTNSNFIVVAQIGNNIISKVPEGSTETKTSAEMIAGYKDFGETFAKGIKLQKLVGTTWTDVKNAEYDATIRKTNYEVDDDGNGNTYIVIKDVSFEHLTRYRLIWTGSADTKTTGTYYGVQQRVFVNGDSNNTGAARYAKTEVIGNAKTIVNTNASSYLETSPITQIIYTTFDSWDSEKKNVVLRVEVSAPLPFTAYWAKKYTLAELQKSFKIVYNRSGGTPSVSSTELVYIDIKDIEFKAEGDAIDSKGNELGYNVMYLTLDPAFLYNGNNMSSINTYVGNKMTYEKVALAWQEYNEYQTELSAWQTRKNAYDLYEAGVLAEQNWWDTNGTAYSQWQNYLQWEQDCLDYEAGSGTVGDGNPGDPGLTAPANSGDPGPVYTNTAPYESNPGPAPTAVTPPAGTQPSSPGSFGQTVNPAFYFMINDGISLSDNAAKDPLVIYLGNTDNIAYDKFEFYNPFQY